ERVQVSPCATQRDEVGPGEAQRLVRVAARPEFPADRIGVDAVVRDAGRDHARADRIVVEYPPRSGGVTHHGHPSVADKAKDGRSRHLANSLWCKLRIFKDNERATAPISLMSQ